MTKRKKKTRERLLKEAVRMKYVVRGMRVLLAAVAGYLFVFQLLLPLLHVLGVAANGALIPLVLDQPATESVEIARRDGVVVVREVRAELFLTGADISQRFLFRLPQMLSAALVLAVLVLLWLVLRRSRSLRFATKGTLRRLMATGYLLIGLSLVGVFVADWCATALAADAGVAASAVLEPRLSAVLGAACVLALLLAAWRSEVHRLLGKPDSATPAVARGPVPLSFSELMEVVPDELQEGSLARSRWAGRQGEGSMADTPCGRVSCWPRMKSHCCGERCSNGAGRRIAATSSRSGWVSRTHGTWWTGARR